MEKSLGNTDVNGARQNVKDIVVFGNGDMFQLLCKASSQNEGWMKSTKAMEVIGGCVVQVTTHQRNHDGTNSVAEALTYVPGVKVADDAESGGRKLVPIATSVGAQVPTTAV
jgi:outer membrane receptor for Fe3+-dicitrate